MFACDVDDVLCVVVFGGGVVGFIVVYFVVCVGVWVMVYE